MPVSPTDRFGNAPLFDQIVANSQTGVAVFDAVYDATGQFTDFRFSYVNPAGAAVLGQTPEALLGRSFLGYFSQAKSSGWLDLYRTVLMTGQTQRVPEVPYQADGIDGWFDLLISRYEHSLVVTYTDITAYKRTQLALEAQALQLRATLDASISSIFYMTAIRNEEAKIIDFLMVMSNKAVLRSNNMTPDQVEGRQLLKVFPGNADNGFFDLYVRVTETGQPESSIAYYRDDVGLEGWFEVSAVKQGDGIVVTFMNITDQKKTENELQQKNEALLRSNQSLQSFAYVASHDLQAPLRKIQSFGDILANQYGLSLDPDAKDILRRLNLATQRMSNLIRDLLMYSRINTQPHELTAVPLGKVLADVLSDLDPVIQETKATVRIEPMPIITGDAVELGQLFQNLLSNALKFRRPNIQPVITITCQAMAREELPVQIQLPGTMKATRFFRIDVADNGIGFDPKNTERIFQMFQRLHTKNEYEGTGIGLAICQKVAENHGGAITALGQPGLGAAFQVYFPA
ncbi:ATP-binding protein [Larkinella bovis]|uniref:histidine kinase n=1 Tax=Larkinella bovis TaxID=683041 RepID=A0ABW0IA22_9BACT